jgi:hypothetical protein
MKKDFNISLYSLKEEEREYHCRRIRMKAQVRARYIGFNRLREIIDIVKPRLSCGEGICYCSITVVKHQENSI